MLFIWMLFCLIALLACVETTPLDDKYHVMITNIPSRGRTNQLIAIAEELLTHGNNTYFVTFLMDENSTRFLEEFIARYPIEDNKENYQIITAPALEATVGDPLNFIETIKVYIWLVTSPFYNIYPTFHQYLELCGYNMTTNIDDYSKYNISAWSKHEIILKAIDCVLSDMLNIATFVITKIYRIPIVALDTFYYGSSESRWYLSDSVLVSSHRAMENTPNYPHYSYLQSMQIKIERFILMKLLHWYIISQYNPILVGEFNITHSMISIDDGADLYSEALILKSMGPPVSIKDTFISQRSQYTGFLLAKHLYEDRPWLDPITVQLFESHSYKELIDWMDDTANIIYVAFGTVIGEDELTVKLFEFLANDVFCEQFLEANDFYILWSIRNETKSQIFRDYNHERVRFQAWIPQKELLHHPHIRLFITHGGTSSILESVFAMKPMLFASFGFVERIGNGITLKKTGCSDYIEGFDHFIVHKQILHLIEVHQCKELREMMEFFDGTRHAMKVVNYAIKFGTNGLVPSVTQNDLSWHQKTNMDIYAMLIAVMLLCYCMLRRCCVCCCADGKRKIHDKKE